jgi:hypothetical protein
MGNSPTRSCVQKPRLANAAPTLSFTDAAAAGNREFGDVRQVLMDKGVMVGIRLSPGPRSVW